MANAEDRSAESTPEPEQRNQQSAVRVKPRVMLANDPHGFSLEHQLRTHPTAVTAIAASFAVGMRYAIEHAREGIPSNELAGRAMARAQAALDARGGAVEALLAVVAQLDLL